MIRWLLFIGFIAAILFGGEWLLDHPGEAVINWLGYEITLHIAAFALALTFFSLVIGYMSVLLWRAATWPLRRRQRKAQRTLKRGLEQLTRGVTALSMGDEAIAEEALKKASTYLPNEPLPQLLTAQLLQRQGKHTDAQIQFRALLQHPTTSGLATRKLIEQHLQRYEWQEALKLTEEARNTAPKDAWLALTLLDLHARTRNGKEILALTEGWGWQSPLTKEQRHRYAALGHYFVAQATEHPRKQEQALRHAVGYAPDFLPATLAYAQLLLAQDSPRRARKWLLEAWSRTPSALLITPILDSIKNEKPRAQLQLLKPFLRKHQTAATHVLVARQAMLVHEPARARAALEKAIEQEETKEAVLLMAEVENELRSNSAANSWTARAVDAPLGAGWVCKDCGHEQPEWTPHCEACHHFDTMEYSRQVRRHGGELSPI